MIDIMQEVIRVVKEIVGDIPESEMFDPDTKQKYSDDPLVAEAERACYMLAGPRGIELAKNWVNAYNGGNMWGQYNAYLTSFRDVLGLELEIYEKYQWYEKAAINGGFRVMHEDFCIVSDFPELIKVDAENRPHNDVGPTYRFRDGWSTYHYHGVAIPANWIEDKESLTPEIALTWENVEQRRAACELLGWNKILEELKAVVVDTDGDPQIGQLLEVDLPGSGKEKFLRVLCGTGRIFALPVPPEMKTALEAQAWSFGMDTNEFVPPEVRT